MRPLASRRCLSQRASAVAQAAFGAPGTDQAAPGHLFELLAQGAGIRRLTARQADRGFPGSSAIGRQGCFFRCKELATGAVRFIGCGRKPIGRASNVRQGACRVGVHLLLIDLKNLTGDGQFRSRNSWMFPPHAATCIPGSRDGFPRWSVGSFDEIAAP